MKRAYVTSSSESGAPEVVCVEGTEDQLQQLNREVHEIIINPVSNTYLSEDGIWKPIEVIPITDMLSSVEAWSPDEDDQPHVEH